MLSSPARPHPGRIWYFVAFFIALVAFAAALFFLNSQLGDLIRVVVPNEAVLHLEQGRYTIFHEHESVIDGHAYSGTDVSGLIVRFVPVQGGAPIELQPSSTSSYEFPGRSGQSVLTFEVRQPGTYRLIAAYPEGKAKPDAVLAVGRGALPGLFGALGISLGGFVAGLVIWKVTSTRRRKALAAYASSAESAQVVEAASARPMEDPTKQTVIIVHGTWAVPNNPYPDCHRPEADGVRWYQIPPDGHPNFVAKLNRALEKRCSPARCWKHCNADAEIFSWSGENAWVDRTRAASNLAAEIDKLQIDGWRCHVVAHSHGGNVVMEALPHLQTIAGTPGLTGTTLGTPFIDAISAVGKLIYSRTKFLNRFAWSIFLTLTIGGALSGLSVFGHWSRVYIHQSICCRSCGNYSYIFNFRLPSDHAAMEEELVRIYEGPFSAVPLVRTSLSATCKIAY